MPELPEVETVRRGLDQTVLGKVVVAVDVTGRRSVRRQRPEELREALVGCRFLETGRIGKYLLVRLDAGTTLVAHLRMSGQLRFHSSHDDVLAPHTHVVMGFEDHSELRFVDPRTFGELFVSTSNDARGVPVELASLGCDALTGELDGAMLHALLARRRTSLKAFLLDQHALAGIGSIYADEICFRAGLRPGRLTPSISAAQTTRLAVAVRSVLVEAVEMGGSSLRDERYRSLLGELGSFQERHAVYGRAGSPCPRCDSPVVVERVAGRSAHFCAHCQC